MSKMDFATKSLIVLFGYSALFCGVRGFHNEPICGRNYKRNPRIIGGEGLKVGEFPWYVSIKETGEHGCGGFIINSRAIISAAHCFKDFSERAANSPKTISVTLAAHNFNFNISSNQTSSYKTWEQDVKVKRIIRHPGYDAFSESGKHDIALLLLETSIQWNQGTRPVCLPTADILPTYPSYSSRKLEFENGEIAVVAGWGTNSNADKKAGTLQKVRLTVYNSEECKRILKEKNVTLKTDIDSSVICAGSNKEGFDSCSGDSGSALLVQRGNQFVAIGIVSSGFGKCGSGRPGLYTRISSYLDWIDFHNDQIGPSIFFQKLTSSFHSESGKQL